MAWRRRSRKLGGPGVRLGAAPVFVVDAFPNQLIAIRSHNGTLLSYEQTKRQGGAFAELVIEVFRLTGQLLQAGDELAKPVGLTSSRWQVLGVVEHAPASVAHVAREMGLSRQSVQRTADLLAEDGLVV